MEKLNDQAKTSSGRTDSRSHARNSRYTFASMSGSGRGTRVDVFCEVPRAYVQRGRGMKQRHSDDDICDQSVPCIDATHEFVTAELWKVPEVEQRETMRKHIGDAQRDHDQQQQIEQPVRRHRGHVEDAAVKRRQSAAERGAPKHPQDHHAGERKSEQDMHGPDVDPKRAAWQQVGRPADQKLDRNEDCGRPVQRDRRAVIDSRQTFRVISHAAAQFASSEAYFFSKSHTS
jgi:hypothetical protein